jgi:Flp pilus assembly pilin Flp
MKLFNQLRSFVRNEEAQDLIEYALLIGLISLVAVVALQATGTSINALFNAISTKLTALA